MTFGDIRPGQMRTGSQQRQATNKPPAQRSRWWRWLIWLFVLAALPALVLLPLRWVNPPISSYMLQSDTPLVARQWLSLEQMGNALPLATVASEDQKFPQHYGFDFEALMQVLAAPGAPSRGASTISQQTSKNLFLWPGAYVRKALEAWITLWLELVWPKQRILEVYLNIAELAPGVYGVWAGAQHYYGVAPSQLSRGQAARLVAVLPSPSRLSVTTPAVVERGQWIEGQMRQLGAGWLGH